MYLFAPLRHLLKEADLQNFRLENGLKIWPALWDYRHPNALCFTAPVRPKKSSSSNSKNRTNGSSTIPTTVTTTTTTKTASASRFSSTAAPAAAAPPPPPPPTSASSSTSTSTSTIVPPPPRDVVFNDVFIGTFVNYLQSEWIEQQQRSFFWGRLRDNLMLLPFLFPYFILFFFYSWYCNRIDRTGFGYRRRAFPSGCRRKFHPTSLSRPRPLIPLSRRADWMSFLLNVFLTSSSFSSFSSPFLNHFDIV